MEAWHFTPESSGAMMAAGVLKAVSGLETNGKLIGLVANGVGKRAGRITQGDYLLTGEERLKVVKAEDFANEYELLVDSDVVSALPVGSFDGADS